MNFQDPHFGIRMNNDDLEAKILKNYQNKKTGPN
jgi:hypothetical protein